MLWEKVPRLNYYVYRKSRMYNIGLFSKNTCVCMCVGALIYTTDGMWHGPAVVLHTPSIKHKVTTVSGPPRRCDMINKSIWVSTSHLNAVLASDPEIKPVHNTEISFFFYAAAQHNNIAVRIRRVMCGKIVYVCHFSAVSKTICAYSCAYALSCVYVCAHTRKCALHDARGL